MSEWIITDEDLGCDGAYFSYQQIVRCKDCIHAYPQDEKEGDDLVTFTRCSKWDYGFAPRIKPDDYCSYGERK